MHDTRAEAKDAVDKRVIIWRSTWLSASETFIRNQMDSLTRWQPHATGVWRCESPVSRASDHTAFASNRHGGLVHERVMVPRIARRHLESEIRRTGAKLVHAHFLPDGIRAYPVTRRANLPLVITVHGFDVSSWPSSSPFDGNAPSFVLHRLRRQRIRQTLLGASGIIAVSEAIRNAVIALGAPPDRVRVLHMGIPLRSPSTLPDGCRRGVLFVGRLVDKKSPSHAVSAWAALPRDVRDEHPLTIIGEGELLPALRRQAEVLGVDVTFTGNITPAKVRDLMEGSRVICMPSQISASGDMEGLPTALLEAGDAGLAVAGYRHSGIPEVITTDRQGLLVDEGDITGLTGCLRRILTTPGMAEQLGAELRRRVHSTYDISTCSVDLEAYYDEVLAARSAGATRWSR